MPATRTHLTRALTAALMLFAFGLAARAQQSYKSPCSNPSTLSTKTFFLANTPEPGDQNQILAAVRDIIDPCIKMYLVPSQSAIIVDAPPEQLAMAEKIITDLDRPQRTYRLLFTVVESGGPEPASTRHYSLDLAAGQHASLNQGTRVPIAKTVYNAKDLSTHTDYEYLDIGFNISAVIEPYANGLRLVAKVEHSVVAPEKSATVPENPILHQNTLEGTTTIVPGKPTQLGSLDVPNSTHHLEITVTVETTM